MLPPTSVCFRAASRVCSRSDVAGYQCRHMTNLSRSSRNFHVQTPTVSEPSSKIWVSSTRFGGVFWNIQIRSYVCTASREKDGQGICRRRTEFVGNTWKRGIAMCDNGKGPGLIVFDLDCTLWPFHVDSTVDPPFHMEGTKIVDQRGTTIGHYPEVPKVLEYLQAQGYPIAVASRTTKPPAAFQLLDLFDWNKFISYREIYPGSKVTHFAKFAEQTKLRNNEMLFFDDEQRNITDMEQVGVKCILVLNGVDLELVKESIEKFKQGKL